MQWRLFYPAEEGTRHGQSHDLVQGEDMRMSCAVLGKYLLDSHGQALPDSNHTDTGEIIQTLVSQCSPCSPGHMTSVQRRVGTIETTHKLNISYLSCVFLAYSMSGILNCEIQLS